MMTFGELDMQVADVLGMDYSISVELSSHEDKHPRCEHLPKIRRVLEWKIWDGHDWYEATTAEAALAAVRASRTDRGASASPEAIKAVDAHASQAEF